MIYQAHQEAFGAADASARILEALPHPILVIDGNDEIVFANAAGDKAFGGWIVGTAFADMFPGYLRDAREVPAVDSMRLTTRQGEEFDGLFSPLGDGETCVSLWSAARPIEVSEAPKTDDLTGLTLRNAFMASLADSLRRTVENDGLISVLCLDLDRFKTVNDTLGHAVGDALLKKVAQRIRNACRKDDVVGRLGGDEFVILQQGISGRADAERLAARLVDLVGRTYVLGGHTVNVSVSVGVALSADAGQARDLLRNADIALYEAKRGGRGRHRFFEAGMDAQLRQRRELEIDLRRALALKQFDLHYQPFLDVETGRVMGFEALLRWTHPVRGDIPPLSFIPIAEENGLIVKIGDWVLSTACMAAASWPGDLVIAVNVSPIQFKADSLLATISAALARSGLAPERLEIEITEGALLDDADHVLATLHALRALGVKISMDDFGTGYSSLSYLQKFPFNKIKIDRSFVAKADPDSDAILHAVSELGSTLGMAITAEGVETVEQLERIRGRNCTHVQGFLTGRPMALASVDAFLSTVGADPNA